MNPNHSPVHDKSIPVSFTSLPSGTHPYHPYPVVPSIQHPPAIYTGHTKRLSEAQRTETTRGQSSISSADSRSSILSYHKQHAQSPSSPLQKSPIMDGDPDRHRSHWERTDRRTPRQSPRRQEMVENNTAVIRYLHEQQQQQIEAEPDNHGFEDDDHAVWVLFWLSFVDPFHSLFSCVFTILTTIALVLISPIRLCHRQVSFGDRVIRILAPVYRNHLQLMYAPSVEHAFGFEFKASTLVLVHLAAPFLSFGVMVAAWVSAAFWVFAFIMGNPDGTERRDDGRDAVLAVRNWWEKYFLQALKSRQRIASAV